MSDTYFLYMLGGVAALISAASWSFTSILWHYIGEKISPLEMNLGKCIIGVIYLGIALAIVSVIPESWIPKSLASDWGWQPMSGRVKVFLAISGILGVAMSDTFFFMSLVRLAPRLAGIIQTLCVVFIIIMGVIFQGDRPSYIAWLGIGLTVAGVYWVVWERAPRQKLGEQWKSGVVFGLLCVITTAISVICAKEALKDISAMQATFMRLIWGIIGLAIWGFARGKLKKWLVPLTDFPLVKSISFVVFVAIFGGFWLSLVAVKYMTVSIASTLNTTDPIFMLPMAAFILKEKLSYRAIIGAVVAVGGVAVIFLDKYIIAFISSL